MGPAALRRERGWLGPPAGFCGADLAREARDVPYIRCPHFAGAAVAAAVHMGMLRFLRQLPAALQELAAVLNRLLHALSALLDRWEEGEGVEARVRALELSRATWEAEIEALGTKVESRFKAARAAEERARSHAEKAEAVAAEGDPEGEDPFEEWLKFIQEGNAQGGAPDGVRPLRGVLEGAGPDTSDQTLTRAEEKEIQRARRRGEL